MFSIFQPQSPSSELPLRFEAATAPEVGQKDSAGFQTELKGECRMHTSVCNVLFALLSLLACAHILIGYCVQMRRDVQHPVMPSIHYASSSYTLFLRLLCCCRMS